MKSVCLMVLFILVSFSSIEGNSKIKKRGIFIADGTKWCGAGNKAEDCEALGYNSETDSCCRTHDYCPYTFSTITPEYNGYKINNFYTTSHCECDLIFHDCLNSKPYKRGSYEIWSSFETIGVKCFAYLPCDDNSTIHDNIWNETKDRRLGTCHKGFKVTIFDFIHDYAHFIENVLTKNQKHIVKTALRERSEHFMSLHKATSPCVHKFPNTTEDMIRSFTSRFIQEEEKFVETELTKSISNDGNLETFIIKTETDKKKDNANSFFISSENLVFALIGLCLLVPTILFIFVISILRVHRAFNKYIFIKNNLSDIQA